VAPRTVANLNVDAALVDGAATAAAAAGGGGDGVHGGIFLEDFHHLKQDVLHLLEGSILVAQNGSLHASVILLREKPLGDANEQIDVQADGGGQNQQRNHRMAQHAGERSSVCIDNRLEYTLTRLK
jgi:hypothetical protein